MGLELLSSRSKVFDQVDAHRVSAYVNEHVGHHEIALSAPTTRAMLCHRRLSELDLCHISYGGLTRVTSRSLRDRYHLQIMLRGSCLQRLPGTQRTLLAGDLVVINPDEPVDLTYSQDCEKFIMKIPVGLLDAVCEEQCWTRPTEGVRFGSTVCKLEKLGAFAQLLSLVCHEAEDEHGLRTTQQHYVQIVARKVLTCLVTNLELRDRATHEQSLQRLLSYIDDNLEGELGNETLARLANMSVRALYTLFDQRVGVTPRSYIIRKKLQRIRAALLDPDCRVRSVTELALDHGFTHLGRFAARYRSQFAELPSQTFSRRTGG
uniref:AraC family transcriptional regulator n=1 Tax=Pseudomonas fluorescens TaxID=294 RepID=UPI00130EC78E|nr:AraC family transcriptional regulator [Pseudomonas fluorescens]